MPMGDELKWLKEEVGVFSESCDISLQNMPTSHTVSLALFIYACCDSAILLLSCACLCNNSKWCLPSFVSPSSYTVLQCFFPAYLLFLPFSLLLPFCIPSFILPNLPFPSLNTVREILCTRCRLALNTDLLQGLAGYKNYRAKSVVMATRSLIQLFRSVHTELLR